MTMMVTISSILRWKGGRGRGGVFTRGSAGLAGSQSSHVYGYLSMKPLLRYPLSPFSEKLKVKVEVKGKGSGECWGGGYIAFHGTMFFRMLCHVFECNFDLICFDLTWIDL